MRMKNYFHVKGRALNVVLIQRPGGTRQKAYSFHQLHWKLYSVDAVGTKASVP